METSQTVITRLTTHFAQFPARPIPDWLPIADWRYQLVAHCRARAARDSIIDLCRAKHWARSSHYRRIRKSGGVAADWMNLKAALLF